MTTSPRSLAIVATLIAAASCLALPATASAKGGSGGGGGAGGGGGGGSSVGSIKVGDSDVAACDNGTNLTVTVGKGSRGSTQEVLVMSGTTAGYWMFRTLEATSGRSVVTFGGNRNELGQVSAVTTVEVGSWLPKGTWDLSFDATRTELAPGAPLDATGALLETCTARLTVTVG